MCVQRVVAVEQAVGHHRYLLLLHPRRQSSQRLYQAGVAVYLVVQSGHDVVVGPAVLAEVLVVGRHLLQCEGQVERHLLFLGVQQYGQFVRLRDDVNHALVLPLVVVVEALLCARALLVGRLQLGAKVFERMG